MKLQDAVRKLSLNDRPLIQDRVFYAIYGLALAVSISIWFLAIHSPLWLDETGSYWVIAKGFSQIWHRQGGFLFLAYSWILWFSTKLIGTSEIALRVPSLLAMLGAVYLLYLAARELFEREIAIITVVIFCLHPIVVYASIDARPYAFAMLATNASILILLRLRRNNSIWLAALFGLTAACILWFQFIFGTIIPALALCFFVVKTGNHKTLWRQFGIALVAFALALLPTIPNLLYMFRASGTYVFEQAPKLLDLVLTLAPSPWRPGKLLLIFALATLVAAVRARFDKQFHFQGWQILLCAALAGIPTLILYGVSVGTSIHCFVERHRLVAVPGIALCWALLFSSVRSRALRLLLCLALVAITAYQCYSSPSSRQHGYTWKYALEYAEKNATPDNAPVLICSDFAEANSATMPLDSPKDNPILAPLSYYKLSVPVVPLPRALNDEAMRVGSQFLQQAAQKHERFLALAYKPSYKTLDWLAQNTAATHYVRNLGVFDEIKVLEFVPRSGLAP
jgi:hypothetical protein